MAIVTGYVRDRNGDLLADAPVRLYRRDTGALLGSAVSGDGTEAIDGDADYASVTLLLHCDGTNGSTTFTDSSPSQVTVTAYGNATISTAQSKFGGASGAFDGTEDYLLFPHSLSDYSGDFTVELWFKFRTTNQITGNEWYSSAYLFAAGPNYSDAGFDLAIGKTSIWLNHAAFSARILSGSWTPDTNWHHLAVTRAGTAFTMWLDGAQLATGSSSAACATHTTMAFARCEPTGESTSLFNGYADDIRITKGVARYTAGFTVPDAAFLNCAEIAARPLGQYSIDTTYSGKVICTAHHPTDPNAPPLILRTTPI